MRDFVLNEASLTVPFPSQNNAETALRDLSRGMAKLVREKNTTKALRCQNTFWNMRIYAEGTVGVVLSNLRQSALTKDDAVFFQGLAQKVPFDGDLTQDVNHRYRLSEAEANDEALLLCGIANFVLVSFPTEEKWDVDELTISVKTLEENDQTSDYQLKLDNVARQPHADSILERARAKTRQGLTLENFWKLKDVAYPFLKFGKDVEEQLKKFNSGNIEPIFNRLDELNNVCITWKGVQSAEPIYQSEVSGESETTMNNYSNERLFRGADGTKKIFETHARVGGANRIYFIPDPALKILEVGYIGGHLPYAGSST